MSKVFYDHLLLIDDLLTEIDISDMTDVEKQQAKKQIDELFHYSIMTKILDVLPKKHHPDFLKRFHTQPYIVNHINYLESMTEIDITGELFVHIQKVKGELLMQIRKHKESKKT